MMARTASLAMYDSPPLNEANDALWALIAARLAERGIADVPRRLDRDRAPEAIWDDPGLLLAQCCGYPLVTRYRTRLRYLATPRYTAPGCSGVLHRSRIVVRVADPAEGLRALAGRRAAVNERHSNTGMNLFRAAIAPLAGGAPFFAEVVETGSHVASMRAVADDRADVAAIDAVSFAHAARLDPDLARALRTIGWTDASPGLPFVTASATPEPIVRLLRGTVGAVVRSAEARPACAALLLQGVERLPPRAYDRLLRIERYSARAHYPELA